MHANQIATRLAFVLLAMATQVPANAIPLTTDLASYNLFGGPPGGFTTSGLYDPQDDYMIGGNDWTARLAPVNAMYLSAPTLNFIATLEAAFPLPDLWSFSDAATELSDNSLIIRTYDVLGMPGGVGAEFHLDYKPNAGDPLGTGANNSLHWIQVVTDNHNLTNNPGHGNFENVVDNPFAGDALPITPYYDDGGAATSGSTAVGSDNIFFYDFPARSDAGASHYWDAELWLALGPSLAEVETLHGLGQVADVTLLAGVRWGWVNYPVPEPATMLLLGVGCVGIAWRTTRRTS